MAMPRLLRHLFAGHAARRFFPTASMQCIQQTIAASENTHGGQIVFAVENALSPGALLAKVDAAHRAREVFGLLRVWDTTHNSGVLIYLLLADRRVEIVADRAIHAVVGNTAWDFICGEMQKRFALGEFEQGVIVGIEAISSLLAKYFPLAVGEKNPNELSDRPIIL